MCYRWEKSNYLYSVLVWNFVIEVENRGTDERVDKGKKQETKLFLLL